MIEQQMRDHSLATSERIASLCCIGRRPDQQDCCGVSVDTLEAEKGRLLLVADGMGGLNYGGEVSRLLVDAMLEAYERRPFEKSAAAFLMQLLGEANRRVNNFLRGKEQGGSTLVAVLIRGDEMTYLSVGDSRIALCRGGSLIPLTREHNLRRKLHMLLLNDLMTPDGIEQSNQKRALTSYVGMGELSEVDISLVPVKLCEGDTVVLMTDGVFGTLTDEEIARTLAYPVQESAHYLADQVSANQREVQDNFTAVLYRA